jgi:hypothetical protein
MWQGRGKSFMGMTSLRAIGMRYRRNISTLWASPFLLLAPGQLRGQVPLPATPAGRLAEWLKVFNDGDRSQIQRYFQQNFPARAPMIDQTMAMRQEVGGFDLEQVEDTTATGVTCLLKTRTGAREVRVVLQVETQEPHRIASIRLEPASALSRPAAPPAAPAPAAQHLHHHPPAQADFLGQEDAARPSAAQLLLHPVARRQGRLKAIAQISHR